MAKPPPTAPRSIGRQLNFTASIANTVANRLLEAHGLSLAQWAVLMSLWRNGDLSVKELAELTGNAPPAVSRIVDRMIAADLLIRTQDPKDRRAVTISLNQKGEGLRHLETIYEKVNAVMFDGLSETDRDALFTLLERTEQNGRRWLG